jgi:hypothetical protein
MRVFAVVIEIAALAVLHARENLSLRSAVAFEFIGDDHPWDVEQAFEQLAKELLCGLRVPSTLYQDIKDIVVLIHCAPQVMALTMDREKHFIQVSLVARPRAPVTELIGVILPKFPTPFGDSFVGHRDAAFEQELFHIAVAQGKAIVEPDPVADDLPGEAVILVACGVSGWCHVWLPILEFKWSGRSHHQGNYVMGQEAGSTS